MEEDNGVARCEHDHQGLFAEATWLAIACWVPHPARVIGGDDKLLLHRSGYQQFLHCGAVRQWSLEIGNEEWEMTNSRTLLIGENIEMDDIDRLDIYINY